jgi:general stress protein 26
MDEDVRERMLSEHPLSMRLATRNDEGQLHNVPVAFAKLDDGRIVFRTDADSVKVKNIEATGRAAGVIDIDKYPTEPDEDADLRGIMVRADASIVDPMGSFGKYDEYERKLVDKYYDGEMPENASERTEKADRVMVVLEPTEWVGWDFRKVNYPA